jgi:hypothetical protein
VTTATGVVGREDVGELSARASREGIAGLSHARVFTLVLLWLLLLGAGVIQEEVLSPWAQKLMSDETGMIALALAITPMIVNRKK